MQPHHRKFIFIAFVTLFAVTAPLLILYTVGYRYNWQRNKIEETGTLLINYLPRIATVSLNNIPRAEKSPARFPGLLPGRYTITVSKEGYYSWEKRLWIELAKTTFAQHMILWKKNPTITTLDAGTPALVSVSPNGKTIALAREKEHDVLRIIDTETAVVQNTFRVPSMKGSTIQKIVWSPQGRRLFAEWKLAQKKGGGIVQYIIPISNTDTAFIPLSRFTGDQKLDNVSWNAHDDDRLYGYTIGEPRNGYTLVEIDFFRGTTQGALRPPFAKKFPYLVDDDLLFHIEDATLVITTFAQSRRALERRVPLPETPSDNVQFITKSPDEILTLFDPVQKNITLIDKNTRTLYPIQETIDGVTDAEWSPQKNRLLFHNGKTLSLLDLEHATKEVLYTSNKKIQGIAWHPDNEYVFFTADHALTAMEIDNRDARNSALLLTMDEQKELFTSPLGNTLFITGVKNGHKGLFALTITER